MTLIVKLLPLLFLLASSVSGGSIYKCTIDGKLVFTDQPCDGEVITLRKTNSMPASHYDETYNSTTWYYEDEGYQQALALSEKYNSPIFIYFHADWCGYCRKLEKGLINTSEGENILSKVIKVKISPEAGEAEYSMFKKLGGTGYPSIFIQKTFDSKAKKHSLTQTISGVWQAKSFEYLSDLINSLL